LNREDDPELLDESGAGPSGIRHKDVNGDGNSSGPDKEDDPMDEGSGNDDDDDDEDMEE